MSKTLYALCAIQTTDAKGNRFEIAAKTTFESQSDEEATDLILRGAAKLVEDDLSVDEAEGTTVTPAEADAPARNGRKGR